jgi:hypothetical protein
MPKHKAKAMTTALSRNSRERLPRDLFMAIMKLHVDAQVKRFALQH